MKYINNGPKDGNKPNYIAIKGQRVYTGEEFEATPKDIKVFEGRFNIEPAEKKKSKPNKPVVQAFSDESKEDEFEFQTEEDAEASLSFFKNSINILDDEKGVK